MATNPISDKWTVGEYLAYEQESDIRHEYIDGEIFAMAGAKENHSLIMMYATIEVGVQLRGTDCRMYSSDTRVKISDTKYLYPDFSVVCGDAEFDDDARTILENPILVAEILSDSTEKYDRGIKSRLYRSLSSLTYYMLIDQNSVNVELYMRQESDWVLKEFDQRDMIIPLDEIGVQLPVSEIYRDMTFEDET